MAVGPLPGEVYHASYPQELHGVSVAEALRALGKMFLSTVDPARVAAIVIEPIQGEGGFNVTPFEFLRALRELCDGHGIVLVADEVQTGFARTGKLFAIEHAAVIPDLVTMAKSLAGGFPLSAVTGRAEIMDALAPGGLGGTYAGNPLALAAAQAVIGIIEEEGLCERAMRLGARLRSRLEGLAEAVPAIAEVRGLGAMIAAELTVPGTREPATELAQQVQRRAREEGVILLTAGMHASVLRFLFPLTIEDDVFEEGLRALEAALRG